MPRREAERQAGPAGGADLARDLQRTRDFLAVQYAVVEALTGSGGWREVLPGFLRAICENLHWDVGDYWREGSEGSHLRCAVFHACSLAPGGAFERTSLETAFAPGSGLPGRVWVSRKPALVPDLALDPDFHRSAAAHADGLRAAFAFPVLFRDRILGVIEFFSREPRRPEPDLIEAFAAAGRLLGQYIQRERTEAQLVRSERELHDFFHNGPLAMNWTAADGTILRANRAELELLGYAEEEYVGRNVAEFHVDPSAAREILQRLGSGETVRNYEAILRRSDDSTRHVLITSNALWENGRLVHARTFTRDITVRKRLQREITQRAREVARANRHKDEFLALLGHELRNPLTPVGNALEILRTEVLDDDSKRTALELLERQFRTLSRLVDDLLDVSRVSLGTLRLRRRPMDLQEAVGAAIASITPAIEARRQRLRLRLSPEPLALHGDPVRLEQAIANLLTNACKYGRPRGVIEVETERLGDQAVLRVRDDGVGIEADLLPHVFDFFRHAPREIAPHRRGLGLGLALVQRLVELHGGRVEAHSEGRGRGSEFVIRLPLGAGARDRAPARKPPLEMREPPGLRVLIVDDDEDVATSLSHLLSIWGFQTAASNDGSNAVRKARHWLPDVVLLDLELPRLDGLAVARRLRGMERRAGGPPHVVVMTGYSDAPDRIAAEGAPVDRTLVKPIEPRELRELLQRLARDRARKRKPMPRA